MIYYLATTPHLKGMRNYLLNGGEALSQKLCLLDYETWLDNSEELPGSYIFTDIERLSISQLKLAGKRCDELIELQPSNTFLNHPLKMKRRYEFLRSLFLSGNNNFNVYRQCEIRTPDKFPVFVRGENDHTWDSLELFHNNEELNNYLRSRNERGFCREETLITEFCDTMDEKGIYRKYSAFIVGKEIIPRHIVFRTNWMVKRPELYDQELMDEELNYVKKNPHQELLRPIFHEAGIQYGRIDYAFHEGKIQVWEINTNPSISTFSPQILEDDPRRLQRLKAHQIFVKRFNSALRSLDSNTYLESIKECLSKTVNIFSSLN